MPGQGVEQRQPTVALGAVFVDEEALHAFAEHRLDRVAKQAVDPHSHRGMTFHRLRLHGKQYELSAGRRTRESP